MKPLVKEIIFFVMFPNSAFEFPVDKEFADMMLRVDNIMFPDLNSKSTLAIFDRKQNTSLLNILQDEEGFEDFFFYSIEKTFIPSEQKLMFTIRYEENRERQMERYGSGPLVKEIKFATCVYLHKHYAENGLFTIEQAYKIESIDDRFFFVRDNKGNKRRFMLENRMFELHI
jgi:hypothetical protein